MVRGGRPNADQEAVRCGRASKGGRPWLQALGIGSLLRVALIRRCAVLQVKGWDAHNSADGVLAVAGLAAACHTRSTVHVGVYVAMRPPLPFVPLDSITTPCLRAARPASPCQ